MNTRPKMRKACWVESRDSVAVCFATSVMLSVPVAP